MSTCATSTRDAATLQPVEHSALGRFPPRGSLAAQAQGTAELHPDALGTGEPERLERLAREDARRVRRPNPAARMAGLGPDEAAKIMGVEEAALGRRPPDDSLAAEAQRPATQNKGHSLKGGIDPAVLADAALEDAARIAGDRL
ncbi:hypothetical protein AURDEDRAFT_123398 [Auricularia subglabra TFB-10046 SS5]|nr:hypothetical protein AURDEDRAFT_123398 [Auricularia subglabra TFB-10046 SS5]